MKNHCQFCHCPTHAGDCRDKRVVAGKVHTITTHRGCLTHHDTREATHKKTQRRTT